VSSRGSRIQPVERADATIGDRNDEALQFQPVTNARRGGAGQTRDCCQDGQRQQPGVMEKFFRALHPRAHFLREPGLPPPLLCEEEPAPS
jgi:hypothetical protein